MCHLTSQLGGAFSQELNKVKAAMFERDPPSSQPYRYSSVKTYRGRASEFFFILISAKI